jgi:hypothetical protein
MNFSIESDRWTYPNRSRVGLPEASELEPWPIVADGCTDGSGRITAELHWFLDPVWCSLGDLGPC